VTGEFRSESASSSYFHLKNHVSPVRSATPLDGREQLEIAAHTILPRKEVQR
jgi:hypothetical protein